jgi:vacuolar-type H+-ATPase subunit C/Vma6
VSPTVDAVTARARGVATHFLRRATLLQALEAPDLESLARVLQDAGLPSVGRPLTHLALELATRRWSGAHLARLARWFPARPDLGDLLFGDEDRRSVRAMLRGSAAGAPRETRLAGLIPTPRLPERLLRELAGQPTVPRIAALLVTWRHPLGTPLLEAAESDEPDLFAAERALTAAALATLARAGRRLGGAFERHAREAIDRENVLLALLVARRSPGETAIGFLAPGGFLAPERIAAAALGDGAMTALLGLLPSGPVVEAMRLQVDDTAGLDDAILAARIVELRRQTRLDPLDPAAVLEFALRLRGQVILVRQAIWRLALGATTPPRAPLLEVA